MGTLLEALLAPLETLAGVHGGEAMVIGSRHQFHIVKDFPLLLFLWLWGFRYQPDS